MDIESEVRDQNRMLDGMDNDFGTASGMIKGTMQRMKHMLETTSTKKMIYVALIAAGVILFLYFLLR
eukprot:CAMPEP_0196664502 /NCGR_PEP_ID=MMETSP1086-20130531/57423_1 /TAXON_ID=77921 /ORGANISM="Cyanoptyche  gloeocystis , Strain SAG4.97" /LENGTH=66 /DNA_ID=CAMNT_0042000847 /DNA_START=162 /DNA_END=362 /DNA_ORIENTATION=+